MKCVYWHAESLAYPIGNATFSTRANLPAGGRQPFRLSPRRTPLFSSSPSRATLIGISLRLQRLRSADCIGFTRGLLLGGNRLASLFQDEFLEQPIKKNGIVLLDFAQQYAVKLRFARIRLR
ncbi:MAG: hypothetical protein IJY46_00790 [Lentisphaeria bacterium]|nr:hypothetical protein [Lentisphaeria bacterium]